MDNNKCDYNIDNNNISLCDDMESWSFCEENSRDRIILAEESLNLTFTGKTKNEISAEIQKTRVGEKIVIDCTQLNTEIQETLEGEETFANCEQLNSNIINPPMSCEESLVSRLFSIKGKYYDLKMKYLEVDIALKKQQLKESRQQEKMKLELLKLEVEERRLLIAKRKLT